MKNIFIGILLISASFGNAQEIKVNEYEVKTHTPDFNLQGAVQKVISTAYDAKGNYATLPFLENEYYNQIILEFDSKGYLSKRTNNLDYRGKLATYSFVDYEYNNQRKPLEIKTTVINNAEDPKRISSLKTFEYTSNGHLLELHETVKSKTSTTHYQTQFTYGSRLESAIIKTDGTTSGELKYSYNKAGNLIKQESIGFDGKNGQKRYFMYEEKQPIYEEVNVNNNKQLTFIDQNNNTTKIQYFDQNQNIKLELTYDQKKQVNEAKVQTFRAGKPFLTTYQIHYQYDDKNNWITATVTADGQLQYNVQREIIYY